MIKLNKKGFTLVEIIIASAMALLVAGFLIAITIKMVNKNNDYYIESLLLADKNIITKEIMDDINNPELKLKSIAQRDRTAITYTFEKIDDPDNSPPPKTLSIEKNDTDGTTTVKYGDFTKKLKNEGNIDTIKASATCSDGSEAKENGCIATDKDASAEIKLPIYTNYSDKDYGIEINIPYKTDEVDITIPDFENNETLCETIVKEKLGLESLINKTDDPDILKTSCSSGCEENTSGIFQTDDNFGSSCYFRGSITNNYVKFGTMYYSRYGYVDLLWRIVRINGDGTIRIAYDSIAQGKSIAYTVWEGPILFNNYQQRLNVFYDNVIISNGLDSYVADSLFCEDKNISKKLTCTSSGTKTNKVGLLRADELLFSGITNGNWISSNHFLWSTYVYWTTTPGNWVPNRNSYRRYVFYNEYNDELFENSKGKLATSYEDGTGLNGGYAIKPVISLKTDGMKFTGDGTAKNPFVISKM